LLLLC